MSRGALARVGLRQRARRKRPNYRLVKIHRNYTVEEIANRFGVHRNTVRFWVEQGLPTLDDRRPTLIHGAELALFLKERRSKNKRKCRPGEIYCVRCRAPQKPAGEIADCEIATATLGNLSGICPSCDSMIYRRINLAKLEQVRGNLNITMRQAQKHIAESSKPSVNCDLKQGAVDNANAQRQQ